MFQSSPALTGGCYGRRTLYPEALSVFQSSPALTGGCYGFSGILASFWLTCFNPHPPLRADAMIS